MVCMNKRLRVIRSEGWRTCKSFARQTCDQRSTLSPDGFVILFALFVSHRNRIEHSDNGSFDGSSCVVVISGEYMCVWIHIDHYEKCLKRIG